MDLSSRKTRVEILEKTDKLDALNNPFWFTRGSFYARVLYPTPKEAISAGTIATVSYAQIFFLASDARRLEITSDMRASIGGEEFEINAPPYQVFEGNRLYVCMNVSRRARNG